MSKTNNFISYTGTAQIEVFKEDTFIPIESASLVEKGKVIATNKCPFLKVGDVVYFAKWLSKKTAKVKEDDPEYWVVPDTMNAIMGVERAITKKKNAGL